MTEEILNTEGSVPEEIKEVEIVGVSFKEAGKIYYFSPNKFKFSRGDKAIVETSRGLELGTVKVNKKGVRRKNPQVSIHVKEALFASLYDANSDDLKTAEKVYDLSEFQSSDKRILIIFEKDGKRCAAIFEGTAKVANLIASFCENGKSLKGQILHG